MPKNARPTSDAQRLHHLRTVWDRISIMEADDDHNS